MQPSEQEGFNLVALKSALMVGALSCGQAEPYNTFMTRFQPEILAAQQAMDAYFARADGLYAQIQEDAYVTELANNQSEASINIGQGFCSANAKLFDSVLALKTPDDLQPFTDANPPAQPIALTSCSAAPKVPATPTVAAAAEPAPVTSRPQASPEHPIASQAGKWVFKNDVMFLVANGSAPPTMSSDNTDQSETDQSVAINATSGNTTASGLIQSARNAVTSTLQKDLPQVPQSVSTQASSVLNAVPLPDGTQAASALHSVPAKVASVLHSVPAKVASVLHSVPAKVASALHSLSGSGTSASSASHPAQKAAAGLVKELSTVNI